MMESVHAAAAEIAHVLFIDVVDYSKQSTTEQSRVMASLNESVLACSAYRVAKERGRVLAIPTGDGMALLFFDDVLAPANCATVLKSDGLRVRMGIHSGLVQHQTDIAGAPNVVGEGINTAQRILDAGDEGHILVSAQYANWLKQFEPWQAKVHEAGKATTKHGEELSVYNLYADGYGNSAQPSRVHGAPPTGAQALKTKIVLLYRRNAHPDDEVLAMLEPALGNLGYEVFIDRHLKIGVEWAKAIEQKIRSADVVLALLSDSAMRSEMLEYEIETAFDENKKRGKPFLLPIRVGTDQVMDGAIGAYVNGLNFSVWRGPQDNQKVVTEIVSAITDPPRAKQDERQLEPVGGAVSPDSPFYIERDADPEFLAALKARESILLVKGPRQIGKTSLIARGIKAVGDLGWRYACTDFQKLSTSQFASEDTFYRLLAATLARQLKFTYNFETEWLDVFGANMNLDNFVRSAVEASDRPFIWFMDEADKLFGVQFASDFFGLVRSWHNSRATEPFGPWSRFTVVIGYATEAHLFIQDLNQSPFNVGRQLPLRNFTAAETAELNTRYGSRLSATQVEQLWKLIEGQPFLTRRALDVVSRGVMDFPTLLDTAPRDDGPFGDHLKRILFSVSQMPAVLEALKSSVSDSAFRESEGVQRLIAAGVARKKEDRIELTSNLYRQYLSSHVEG